MTVRTRRPESAAIDSKHRFRGSSSRVSMIIGAALVLLALGGWLISAAGLSGHSLTQLPSPAPRGEVGRADGKGRGRNIPVERNRRAMADGPPDAATELGDARGLIGDVQAPLLQGEASSARLRERPDRQHVPQEHLDQSLRQSQGVLAQLGVARPQALVAAERVAKTEPDVSPARSAMGLAADESTLPPAREAFDGPGGAGNQASPQAESGPLAPQSSIDTDMLLLEVTVDDRVIGDSLVAYQSANDILLPLGGLSSQLTIAITVDPAAGTADGYVVDPARTFSLDVKKSTAWVEGRAEALDLGQIDVQPDDIYVSSELLSRWLPVDFSLDMSRLSLTVRPREQLPLQFRLAREARAEKLDRTSNEPDPSYPLHVIPYRGFRAPFIDQTLSIDYLGGKARADYSGSYSAYATGDLLGMEAALYVNASSGKEATDVRLTLGRNDPDARLLGPLQARTALFGNVPLPGIDKVSRTSVRGEGVMISNRPLSQPTGFGQHSLQGPLAPGWDVELYYNDMLIGFQSADESGQYQFVDQPLVFGTNEFRLVFHGPLGQVRVETETFLLEQSLTAAGEFYYQVAHQRDEEGAARSLAQFDWGLSDHLVVTGGLIAAPVAGQLQHFTNVGMQAHWRALILGSKLVKSTEGRLTELALRTRLGKWAVSASRAQLENFASELYLPGSDPVRSDTWLKLDGDIAPTSSLRLPVSLAANHERRSSGASKFDVAGRVSAHVRGTSLTGQLRWQSLSGREVSDATVQVSRRVRGIGLRSQLTYAIAPEPRLKAVALNADRRLAGGYLQTFGLTRMLDSSETLYSAGLTKSIGNIGYGINTGYSSTGAFNIGARIFVAMGRDPRRHQWEFDAQPMASTGAVSALVFLDDNLNGQMEAHEQPIEGVSFNVNGGRHPIETDAKGVAHLNRLPVMQRNDIEMVTSSLDDPQWVPSASGRRLTPRPGVVAEIQFPVISTSEIEGTVYLSHADGRRGIGSLPIELVDASGNAILTAMTAQDGYYVFVKVPPGVYRTRVAAEALKQYDLESGRSLRVTVSADEWLVRGVDIELKKLP